MHFSSLAVVALFGSALAQTVTFYSDAACKNQQQVIKFTSAAVFQCGEVTNPNGAQSAIISKKGYGNTRGYNVWDSDYCAGDMAGGLPSQLGKCLPAKAFGLQSWKSAHISPRNESAQGTVPELITIPVVIPSTIPTIISGL